jgi:Zn-dependent M28 family amino/carboxypeptidase
MATQLLPLNSAELELSAHLEVHVKSLASDARGRNHHVGNSLAPSRFYITEQFLAAGYKVFFQEYSCNNITYANIEVELLGTKYPDEIIVIGAHYDSVIYSPGANDNASGVAAVLEIARLLNQQPLSRTVRLVAFVNEEPPFFQTKDMGSLVYAKRSAANQENIVAMFTLETIGYFSEEQGSQTYPPLVGLFYPDKGNFIALVSNLSCRHLLQKSLRIFREQATIPAEAIALPTFVPGVDWSDQWSFWQYGYPGIMITDTAFYRYPYYHTPEDTPDKIDYENMTRVVMGMYKVIESLSN